jgi:hypothetical protein
MRAGMNAPEIQRMMQSEPFVAKPEFFEKMSQAMASRSVRLAKQTVDSAALVFAHTLLDGALSECCHVSFLADPAPWCSFVEGRKVDLRRFKSKSVKDVNEELAHEHVFALGRESMMKRLEVLNGMCIPRLKGVEVPTAWIRLEAMRDFDHLRQKIIHGRPVLRRRVAVADELYFAKNAGISVLIMVQHAYGLLAKGSIDTKSHRTALRLCAVCRREFPEFADMMNSMLAEALEDKKPAARIGI